MKKWYVAGAKIQGIQHKRSNVPCQDAFKYLKDDNFVGSAVSDGAGSSKYAQIGAEETVQKITDLLKTSFDNYYIASEYDLKTEIIRKLRGLVKQLAQIKQATHDDFNTTLMFVAIKDNRYIAGHIGDGAIGVLEKDNLKSLSIPLNGQYRNQTYFVTSNGYQKHFRVYRGTLKDIEGFILATDGTTDSLYNYRKNEFAAVSKKIIKWLDDYTQEVVNQAIKENLENVLSKRTRDDCTLVIMRKVINNKNTHVQNSYSKRQHKQHSFG